jgi:carbon starvation protein
VGTTVLIKMDRARYAWVTLLPLAWLILVTMTAGIQKVFADDPRLGFLSHARSLADSADPNAARMILNDRLDAALALAFMAVVVVVIAASAREWWMVLTRKKAPTVSESPFVETAYAPGD